MAKFVGQVAKWEAYKKGSVYILQYDGEFSHNWRASDMRGNGGFNDAAVMARLAELDRCEREAAEEGYRNYCIEVCEAVARFAMQMDVVVKSPSFGSLLFA